MSKQMTLIILAIISGLSYLGIGERTAAMGSDLGLVERQNAVASFSERDNHTTCSAAAPERPLACLEKEQKILAMTLKIEISSWIMYVEDQGYVSYFSNGHGTVMDGRYLVTHNHFQLPLQDLLADEQKSQLATVTLYRFDGEQLWQGPLTAMRVVFEDSETLLLEFQDQNGRGLFEALGIPSADFELMPQAAIQPGAEVAQINWDLNRAYVQWTNVKTRTLVSGTSVIRLSDCIVAGSSGGGVFVEGVHIANNWSRAHVCDEGTEDETQYHSTAALNSVELLAASQ